MKDKTFKQNCLELIQEAILDAEHGPHKDASIEFLNGYVRGLQVAMNLVLEVAWKQQHKGAQ